MHKQPLGIAQSRLVFANAREREAVAEACYEAVTDIARHEMLGESNVTPEMVRCLIDLANRVSSPESSPKINLAQEKILVGALSMSYLRGEAIKRDVREHAPLENALASGAFMEHKTALRALAGHLLDDLGAGKPVLEYDASAYTNSAAIEDSRLAGS